MAIADKKSRADLEAQADALLPDNNSRTISPLKIRTTTQDNIESNLNNVDAKLFDIASKDDLPLPSGGVITLEDETTYLIRGAIDLGSDRIQMGADTQIAGLNSGAASITSTATPIITSGTGNSRIGSTTISGSDSINGIEASSGVITVSECPFIGLDGGVILSGSIDASIRECQFAGNQCSIDMSGTSTLAIAINDCLFINYVDGIDFTGSTMNTVFVNNSIFESTEVASFGIIGDAASGNIVERGRVNDCVFNGDGGALSGITSKDIKWEFQNCDGVTSSYDYGFISFRNNATATVISVADTYTTITTGAGWDFAAESSRFTESPDGSLVNNSQWDFVSEGYGATSIITAGGVGKTLGMAIFEDGIIIPESEVIFDADADGRTTICIAPIASPATGKVYDLRVKNVTDTTNLTVVSATLRITRL
jgi:hypothetical protein